MDSDEKIEAAVDEVMGMYYAASPLRLGQIHEVLARRLGVEVADRALKGIGEDLGDLTFKQLAERLAAAETTP